jgi:hypothetical protein
MVQTPVKRSDDPSLESIESVIMNRWVSATWDEFVEVSNRPEFERSKSRVLPFRMIWELSDCYMNRSGFLNIGLWTSKKQKSLPLPFTIEAVLKLQNRAFYPVYPLQPLPQRFASVELKINLKSVNG